MNWIRRVISDRGVWGLFLINFVFQSILRITSRRIRLLHFTNVISADRGLELTGVGQFAERCMRINGGILIQASNGVHLDRSALLGPGVKIISGNHDLADFGAPSTTAAPIEIGANCWIGANAVVLPGVRLLPDTIVGAGSVVTRSPETGGVVIAGNPARVVRRRTNESEKDKGF